MTVTCVSSFTLGAIAINRWFVVCHPLQAIKFDNLRKISIIGMVFIWFFSLTTLSPVAFKTELNQTHDIILFPELELLKECVENWQCEYYCIRLYG